MPETPDTDVSTQSTLPPLPTREEIADGMLRGIEKVASLAREAKYRLYRAVEQLIEQKHTADAVFAAIGVSRALYYERIWFTDEDAAAFETEQKREAKRATKRGNRHPRAGARGRSREKTPRTPEQLRVLARRVDILCYEHGRPVKEARRTVGISEKDYYQRR